MPLSMSPSVNQHMQMPSQEEETQIFEQGFSQAAEGMLVNKMPGVVEHVLTFKVIKSDIDAGSAIGAFILTLGEETIYIPVVLLENELKPLEVMFVKSSGTFLPLTNEWVQEVQRNQMEPMGEGVERPNTLANDVDISSIVRPPEQGRFSYAAADDLKLAQFLEIAGPSAKTKLAALLKENHDLLRTTATIYGKDNLKEMLTVQRAKAAQVNPEAVLCSVFTRKDGPKEIRAAFGTKTAAAMQDIARKGYAVKDKRAEATDAVLVDKPLQLQEVTGGGFYTLAKTDGTTFEALVIPTPIDPYDSAGPTLLASSRRVESTPPHKPSAEGTLVLPAKGDCTVLGKSVIGEPVQGETPPEFKKWFSGTPTPPRKGWGVFMCEKGTAHEATLPVHVRSVTTDSAGVRRVQYSRYPAGDEYTFVTDPAHPVSKIRGPSGSKTKYLPAEYTFHPCKEGNNYTLKEEILTDPAISSAVVNSALIKSGSHVLKIFTRPDGLFYTSDDRVGFNKLGAAMRLVLRYNLREKTAEDLLSIAEQTGSARVVLVTPLQKLKLAMGAPAAMPPASQQQPGAALDQGVSDIMGGQPGMPPQGMPPQGGPPGAGMDPSMMAPPSPLDQAIQEVRDKITEVATQQQQQLEMQMQSLQQQLATLEAVGTRTEEVAQGVPKDQSPTLQENEALDPRLMQEAQAVQDPTVYDTTAVASLADSGSLSDAILAYIPTLMKGLDHIGRILMTFWMKGPELKQELGEEKYNTLEDKLRNVFKGVGDLMLNVNQHAQIVRQGGEFSNEIVNGS